MLPVPLKLTVTSVTSGFSDSSIDCDIVCSTFSSQSSTPFPSVSCNNGLKPSATSSPSERVSPSVSFSNGFVLYVFTSSLSESPSLSVSALFGSVPS